MSDPINKDILNTEKLESFRDWLSLNTEELTWQGRYEDEFNDFWKVFFVENISYRQLIERIEYAKETVKIGPLYSWFHWIRDRFISYVYIFEDLSLIKLSEKLDIDFKDAAYVLRNFFNSFYPHLEDSFNEIFQVGHICNPNLDLSFSDLKKRVDIQVPSRGSHEDDILSSLEITLYNEWKSFYSSLKGQVFVRDINVSELKKQHLNYEKRKFLKEVVIYFSIGAGLLFGINHLNKWYEKELVNKIGVFELDFLWLNEPIHTKDDEKDNETQVVLNSQELKKIEDAENQEDDLEFEEERFAPESEVILTSVDALPKDFGSAQLEQSEYEEIKQGGFRDSRYGHRKVYRVLMKSDDTSSSTLKVNELLNKYGVTQRGNVRPGTVVPGGAYYNLFVPRKYLKEFLTNVMELEESTLYENRSRGSNPPGKNRVFVWIKQI